jgi:long-chain fatty acid transport protein
MKRTFSRGFALALCAYALVAAAPSFAADGYFLIGYGARQKALGGAGVADSRDAMALSVNPAGIVGLERQFQVGMTAAISERGYSTTGIPRSVAPGDIRSGRPLFPVPNSGYVQPIDADSAWGVTTYANGGINTSYSFWNFKAPLGGPLGGGFAGVDLQQGYMSIGYARKFATGIGSISIGFAPTIVVQMINIQGLKLFSPYSSNMYELSDMAYDWSYGGGVRGGLEWRATDKLRFAFAASSPMFMSRFEKYSGLIANGGDLDIPASMQAGLAYDLLPDLTIMADWRHIFYSAVPALGNPANPLTLRSLGTIGGPGFDWTDTDSAAFGAEWRVTNYLTLRGGYHYTTNPLRARSVTVNILSPIIDKHHVSGGFNYQATRNSSLDFAVVYAFKNSFTGPESLPQTAALPFGGYNPRATITPWVRGVTFTVGYNYKWDAGDNSWIPTHF